MSDLSVNIPLNKDDVSQLELVTDIINRSISMGDPRVALRIASNLNKGLVIRGVALARLLYELRDKWHLFNVTENFYDAVRVETGIATETVHKYIRVHETVMLDPQIDDKLRERLMERSMDQLLLLPAVWSNIDLEQKEALALTTSKPELRKMVRELNGAATSSETAVIVKYEVSSGTLSCRQGSKGPFTVFGQLYDIDNPAVQKAIERVTKNCMVV